MGVKTMAEGLRESFAVSPADESFFLGRFRRIWMNCVQIFAALCFAGMTAWCLTGIYSEPTVVGKTASLSLAVIYAGLGLCCLFVRCELAKPNKVVCTHAVGIFSIRVAAAGFAVLLLAAVAWMIGGEF